MQWFAGTEQYDGTLIFDSVKDAKRNDSVSGYSETGLSDFELGGAMPY